MSLADGEAYNNKLMPLMRGDVLPDRSIPVEYMTYDLWESMRAHDLEMANEILEPVFTFMRAQTDSSRLKNMDLKEYFEYRERDVGKGYVASPVSVLIRKVIGLILAFQPPCRPDALLHEAEAYTRGPGHRTTHRHEL
jgi:aristolochene synthase